MKLISILSVALALATPSLLQAQRGTSGTLLELPVRIIGTAISAGGIGNPTGTARVEITIDRFSTASEREQLLQAVKSSQQELLQTLQHARSVGTIRFDTQLAWDLRYASARRGADGGVEVFLATDRPMTAWEIWNQPRYSNYPFTLIELQLAGERRGRGEMILAAQITADASGRFVHVENFASTPVQLNDLEVEAAR